MGSAAQPTPKVTRAPRLPYFTPANNAGSALPLGESTPTLFTPLTIRNLTLKNRIIVAPMCMYSAESDPSSPAIGALTDYHIAHLGHYALKGAGLVFIEATSVQPNGRISPNDSGLWQVHEGIESQQFRGLKRVVDFMHAQGAKVAIQLAHAGRKASVVAPWVAAEQGAKSIRADEDGHGWPSEVVGPSGGEEQIWAGNNAYWPPRELSVTEIQELVQAWAKSAQLAVKAGVDVIEIHAAHGYLLHQFLSPVTNRRTDAYGGTFENRIRLVQEIALAIRHVIPDTMPLFLRVSGTEWLEDLPVSSGTGSWDIPSTISLAKLLPAWGVDLIDVSSGGNHKDQKIEPHTKYQIDIAGQVRQELHAAGIRNVLVGAVGWITQAETARDIVQGADADVEGKAAEALLGNNTKDEGTGPRADVVLIARQFLRDSAWVLNAARELGVKINVPHQFGKAI